MKRVTTIHSDDPDDGIIEFELKNNTKLKLRKDYITDEDFHHLVEYLKKKEIRLDNVKKRP